MTLLDPTERSRRGLERQSALLAAAAPEPATLVEASWRDFVFAEVWSRPRLDVRSRYLIAIASATCAAGPTDPIESYVRGALSTGELTVAELREGALQLAVYAGWSAGVLLDRTITAVADELDMAPVDFSPIRAEPWDPDVRHAEGRTNFAAVMVLPGPPPATAYFAGGILNFVFGEMWLRPGLDQRARRWITLVGVAHSSSDIPIRTHTYAAMASGNATRDEMDEFVLQYAIHGGWPKASVMQSVVTEMADRVEKGLPYA